MGKLAGKIALVTGGASGLGEAIVRRFAAEGATVFIADIAEGLGVSLAQELGPAAIFVPLDVTSEDGWLACFARIGHAHGRLDILVNNAGVVTIGSVEALSLAEFKAVLDIDLVSVFLGCKHVVPLMQAGGGSIINMSSLNGLRAGADLVGYCSAKAGVTMLTKSAALHYAARGYGIRCNSIHPGAIHTPIMDKLLAQSDAPDEMMAGWVADHPIGRIGQPAEVAALALYLASNDSSFSTGAQFVVDGGAQL